MRPAIDQPFTPSPGPEARDILADLAAGNRRFSTGLTREADVSSDVRRALVAGQSPPVAVLGCTDSRVPPELVFDQGLGRLFVVRVAGGVVAPLVLDSLEFAVDRLHVSLIVVLGHSACGAVEEACTIQEGCTILAPASPERFAELLRSLGPIVAAARSTCDVMEELVEVSARLSVKEQAALLLRNPLLSERVHAGRLFIQGAWYDQSTGSVTWL